MYNFMDWVMDRPYRTFGLMGVISVSFIGVAVWAGVADQKKWDAFASSHDCKIVGKEEGSVGTGFSNGKVATIYIPGKTTYHCNDGINYTR